MCLLVFKGFPGFQRVPGVGLYLDFSNLTQINNGWYVISHFLISGNDPMFDLGQKETPGRFVQSHWSNKFEVTSKN